MHSNCVVECKVVEVGVEADNKGRSYVLKKVNKHGRKALGRSRNRRKKINLSSDNSQNDEQLFIYKIPKARGR